MSNNNKLLAREISNITHDFKLKSLLNSYGLDAHTVCWEDTSRTKNSCVGPNISDMTLRAEGTDMPVIRRPNFADITVDHPIDKFNVTVGNESDDELKRISLTEYLENICDYTDNRYISKLINEEDKMVLCSTQACMLPALESEVNFNVRMYNYQTTQTNPAVLVIISSNQGTSAQVLNSNTSDVLFNLKGMAYDFVAERLKEERKRLGKDLDTPMSEEEKERNVLFIYQIPLLVPKPKFYEPIKSTTVKKVSKSAPIYTGMLGSTTSYFSQPLNTFTSKGPTNYNLSKEEFETDGCEEDGCEEDGYEGVSNYLPSKCKLVLNDSEYLSNLTMGLSNQYVCSLNSALTTYNEPIIMSSLNISNYIKESNIECCLRTCSIDETIQIKPKIKLGLDNAMLRVSSDSKGKFDGTRGLKLERDFRYPIRCTLQYYWITDNAELNESQVKQIATQLEKFYVHSENKSSLVVSETDRPTEPKKTVIEISNPDLTVKPLNNSI